MPIDLLIFHNFSPPFMTHIISTPRPHLPHRAARRKCVRINQGINNSPPSPRQQTKLSPQRSGRKNHTSKSKLNTTQIVYNGFLSNQTTLAKLYTPTAVHKQTQPLHPSPPFKKKRDSFPTPPTTHLPNQMSENTQNTIHIRHTHQFLQTPKCGVSSSHPNLFSASGSATSPRSPPSRTTPMPLNTSAIHVQTQMAFSKP